MADRLPELLGTRVGPLRLTSRGTYMKVSVKLSSPASPTTRHVPLRWPESRRNSRAPARHSPPTAPSLRCSTWRASRTPLHLGTLHILQRSFAEADDALLMRCRRWSKGRRAWRARNELRGVDRRALPSRRVQRKAVLRTPEPIENELFQSRRRPLVCRLVDQITHLVRILAVVV